MDKKMLTTILGVALIGCFFLPYLKIFGTGISGFDIVTAKGNGKEILMKYIWVLIPLSGLMLVIGALNNGNYPGGRVLWCWLPLLTCIFVIVKLFMDSKGEGGRSIGVGDLFKVFGIGFWISMAASLVLALYNPRAKS